MPTTFPKKTPPSLNAVPLVYTEETASTQSYLPEIFKGLGVSMSHFFKNTKEMLKNERPDPVTERISDGIQTISYPEQKRPYPERFRGVHRLTTREDDSPRCVACLCCSTACPAQCIYIDAGEYPEGDPKRGYERYPVKFVIDELRCIFCGYCVEACPCDAIRMDTGLHAVPYDSREQFIYNKDLLLAMPGRDGSHKTANPRHEPGDPSHPGIDREHGH
ncbi:MAG: NADH-ubiquinone oxidoreductase chain [Myxococcaceae bacterium]|jgi:NADH-quinone oxidoreductase subunit I|nr:NADH-ubiquinone oxidoreductase chain [Myxococcaceae bacterium]